MTEQQAVIRAPNASSIWACLRSSRPVPGWWLKEGHREPCKLIVCPFSSLHPEQLLRERNINWGHRRILKAFNDWGGGIVTPVKSLTLQGRNEANPPLPCHQWNGIPPPLSVIQAHFALTKWWTQIADIKKNLFEQIFDTITEKASSSQYSFFSRMKESLFIPSYCRTMFAHPSMGQGCCSSYLWICSVQGWCSRSHLNPCFHRLKKCIQTQQTNWRKGACTGKRHIQGYMVTESFVQ